MGEWQVAERPKRTDDIGEYLLSARSFEEYVAMFCLDDEDFRGAILDCPGGGASFTAAACSQGIEAIAIDPVYVRPTEEIASQVLAELERGESWTRATAGRYRWDFYGSPEGHARLRRASAEAFVRDLAEHRERYRAGSLPCLPFADNAFDLVLCSHFLFTYSDRLSAQFHHAALVELARVSRTEARVFPLVHHAGRHDEPLIERLIDELTEEGLSAEVRSVNYEFQQGASAMLVVAKGSLNDRPNDIPARGRARR